MKILVRTFLLIAAVTLAGCNSQSKLDPGSTNAESATTQTDALVGEEHYDECNESDAEIRLDVSIARTDTPDKGGTISFYLKKVNTSEVSESGGVTSHCDVIDADGDSVYKNVHLNLSDIRFRDARFEFSYERAKHGYPPSIDIHIDTRLSLTEPTRQIVENGVLVTSSVTRLNIAD